MVIQRRIVTATSVAESILDDYPSAAFARSPGLRDLVLEGDGRPAMLRREYSFPKNVNGRPHLLNADPVDQTTIGRSVFLLASEILVEFLCYLSRPTSSLFADLPIRILFPASHANPISRSLLDNAPTSTPPTTTITQAMKGHLYTYDYIQAIYPQPQHATPQITSCKSQTQSQVDRMLSVIANFIQMRST